MPINGLRNLAGARTARRSMKLRSPSRGGMTRRKTTGKRLTECKKT